ncbi:HlyC/CorC family transporter [Halobacillus fulvus]|nr:HlyC/CorC family transporter [Halobacillus fulvus]
MDIGIRLFAVAFLILLTAVLVASEYAIIKVRNARVEAEAEVGKKKAVRTKKMVERLDDYLFSFQFGVTVFTLAAGWIGGVTLERVINPNVQNWGMSNAASAVVAVILSFLLLTFFHMIFGELVPKAIGTDKAEGLIYTLSGFLLFYTAILTPFTASFRAVTGVLSKGLGISFSRESSNVHSEEELRHLLSQSYQKGEINLSEFTYMDRIFEFDNRTAKEIMIPRTEMAVLDIHDSIKTNIREMKHNRYTRYPVIDREKDNILGIVHLKELLFEDLDELDSLHPFVRPVIQVFENIPIQELLVKLRKERTHMAILVDEYGGTSGIVTVEDIIEEIVGEIRDEFDHDEERDIRKLKNGRFLIDGKTPLQDVNDYFEVEIEHQDIDTISGWIYTQSYEAEEGTVVPINHLQLKVVDMDNGHIRKIEAWYE